MMRNAMALALVMLVGCATFSREKSAPKFSPPEDWHRVEVGTVSIALPPGVEAVPGQAATGVMGRYQGEALQVNVHSGDFASSLKEFESATGSYEWIEVDGRRARGTSAVIDQRAYDGIFVPEPGKELQPLSVLCVSLTPAAREQAMLVLQSIEFKKLEKPAAPEAPASSETPKFNFGRPNE